MATNTNSTPWRVRVTSLPPNLTQCNLAEIFSLHQFRVEFVENGREAWINGFDDQQSADDFVSNWYRHDIRGTKIKIKAVPDERALLSPKDARELSDSVRLSENMLSAMRLRGNSPGTIMVASWNCKAGTAARIRANTQRIYIREILNALDCDLIALQELPWVPDNFVFRVLEHQAPNDTEFFRHDYQVIGTKNAAIYFDPNAVQVGNCTRRIQVPPNRRALNGRFTVGHVRIRSRNILKTSCNSSEPRSQPYEFLFVSVHMPKTGYSNPARQNNALWLINAINQFSLNFELPVFIGGDFNTSLETMELPQYMYSLYGNQGIDYVLYSGRFTVNQGLFDIFERSNDRIGFRHFNASAVRRLASQNASLAGLINAYRASGSHTPEQYQITFTTL